jgi:hypothetical protein
MELWTRIGVAPASTWYVWRSLTVRIEVRGAGADLGGGDPYVVVGSGVENVTGLEFIGPHPVVGHVVRSS